MTATATARLFRSPELRDLARLAVVQGWTVDRLPGGHVRVRNPASGAWVDLSATGYVNRGTLAAKRHEFAQAGLDLAWSRKRARVEERRRAHAAREVAPMVQVHDVERVEPAPIAPDTTTQEVRQRQGGRQAGGRFALTGPWEVLDVGGHEVRVGHRADDAWVAITRDLSRKGHRRNWMTRDRDSLLANVAESIAQEPPTLEAPLAEREVAPALEAPPTQHPAERRGSFHVVQASPEEFPLAAALDALDAQVAPAIAALEAAGKRDAAALLVAELERTPLESEVLALYRRVMTGE